MNDVTAWMLLFVAGLFEMAWAVGLEYADGFTNLVPSLVTVVALVASMLLLARAVQTLPVGTAYAVWTGIGAVGTAVFGIYALDEPSDPLRLACIGLVVVGIVGLQVTSA